MESPNAFSQYAHRWRMASWIMIGGSVLAMAWGLKVIVAHGGIKGVNPVAAFVFVFGFIPLLVGVVMLFTVRSQGRAYGRITSSGHAVLLRWQCTKDEAKRFVAAEAVRLKVSRRATFYFSLAVIAVGLWVAYVEREDFKWGWFFTSYGTIAGFLIFCYFWWRVTNATELRAARQRATSEVIVDAEGLVAGADVFKWRSFNWGLEEATYESGQPDVLNLVFLAGTLPGTATLGVLRTAAFDLGAASSPGGSTQTHVNVRLPVTASKSDDVRDLLSTTIAQHLLTPAVVA